jgi:hypothetical protein
MAKNADEQPDKKEIDKMLKRIKQLREKIKQCNKNLKNVCEFAKELDKKYA